MNHYISTLPTPMINILWDKVAPLLQLAVDRNDREFTLEQVHDLLLNNKMTALTVLSPGGELLAASVIERVQYPNKSSLRVTLLGGYNMGVWLEDLVEYIDILAKDSGVEDIQLSGRRGWARRLSDYGYSETYIQMTKKVGGNDNE